MAEQDKIIHISQICPASAYFLDPPVKGAQVKICKVLRDQVADGHSFSRLGMIGFKQLSKNPEKVFVFDLLGNLLHHDVMVNGIKIFADVQFEIPVIILGILLRPCQGLPVSFAFTAGIGIIDGISFQNGFTDIHNGMMQHSFRK